MIEHALAPTAGSVIASLDLTALAADLSTRADALERRATARLRQVDQQASRSGSQLVDWARQLYGRGTADPDSVSLERIRQEIARLEAGERDFRGIIRANRQALKRLEMLAQRQSPAHADVVRMIAREYPHTVERLIAALQEARNLLEALEGVLKDDGSGEVIRGPDDLATSYPAR